MVDLVWIYGLLLVFEVCYGNFGWWLSEDDCVEWVFVEVVVGEYKVYVEYVCYELVSGDCVIFVIDD